MNLELYLLAVCDRARGFMGWSIFIMVVCFIAFLVFLGNELGSVLDVTTKISSEKKVEYANKLKMYKLLFAKLAIVFAVSASLFSLVPTRDDIVKAYMMQEGAKLVTAKNADKAIEEFTKRLDKVIEHFTESK